jgi:hypothetical protein
MVILGALFTFLAIAYSTTRAATQGTSIGANQPPGAIRLDSEQGEDNHTLITSEPSERRRMRADVLRAAVDAGSLPVSALDESDDDESIHQGAPDSSDKDDERGAIQYHYSTFHFVFFLATCYTACLLTSWNTMKLGENPADDDETFIYIGRSMAVVWVKIISSWIVYLLYGWSLLLPVVMETGY